MLAVGIIRDQSRYKIMNLVPIQGRSENTYCDHICECTDDMLFSRSKAIEGPAVQCKSSSSSSSSPPNLARPFNAENCLTSPRVPHRATCTGPHRRPGDRNTYSMGSGSEIVG